MNTPPPYHVLDIFQDRGNGILLIDFHVALQSLARVGLVLLEEWLLPMPISEARAGNVVQFNQKCDWEVVQAVPKSTGD